MVRVRVRVRVIVSGSVSVMVRVRVRVRVRAIYKGILSHVIFCVVLNRYHYVNLSKKEMLER